MAIIYSYPKQTSLQSTDLLISTRFSTEPGVVPRSISFSLETLTEYINAAAPIPTLDQVLASGDISLQTAGIGELGLWDIPNGGYATIAVSDSEFTFYDYIGNIVAYISNSGIGIKANSFTGVFVTSNFTANRQYTMPNKSGTIALTNDMPSNINYGLFTQTANSAIIVNTNSELSLIGTGLGSLSVPAYGFNIGDSFRASLMGHISCLGSATLRILVKAWNGFSYSILGDTGEIDLDAVTDQHWNLDVDFTIRALGGAEDASIVSGGSFYYNKSNGNIDLRNFVSENNTDFDTESNNEIVITAQFNNASTSNSIYSNLFTLTKTY
jgi:hypothetical protein